MTDKITQSNALLEEIATETPEKLICTEIGTILQDYISAYISQYNINKKQVGHIYGQLALLYYRAY